jgi:hypothetical protein
LAATDRSEESERNFLEARSAVVVGGVLLRVNAIHGAGIDASGVLYPDAGFGNDVCHGSPPHLVPRNACQSEDSSEGYGRGDWEELEAGTASEELSTSRGEWRWYYMVETTLCEHFEKALAA